MAPCSISEFSVGDPDCDGGWVWWTLGVSCTLLLVGSCFIVALLFDTFGLRRRLVILLTPDAAGETVAVEADNPIPSEKDTSNLPLVLRVSSPNEQRECSGDYLLVCDIQANGQPIYKNKSAERWLYSGVDGRWYICGVATKERNFRGCASGYIFNSRLHRGALPHQVGGSWEWSGGLRWHFDPAITVSCPLQEVPQSQRHARSFPKAVAPRNADSAYMCSPTDNKSAGSTLKTCEGTHPTVLGAAQVGKAAWFQFPNMFDRYRSMKQDSIGDESTQDDSNNSFRIDSCDTTTEDSLGDSSASSPASSSHVRAPFAGFSVGGSEMARSTPRRSKYKEPSKMLCVISPTGQRECAGTYLLVEGTTANGHPIWRQEGGERWLYSGTTGRWCIGGKDVQEDNFQRNSGFISQTAAHKGVMPDRMSGVWQRWAGEAFVKDCRIAVIQLHGVLRRPLGESRPGNSTLDLRCKRRDGLPEKLEVDLTRTILI
uniref:Uncharacterized protein n=1 Tax=Alexandrium monilatum TaxID=311494 RepID=A0A7S4QDQ3_9DINO